MDPIQRLSPKELIFNIRRQRLWEKNLIAQNNLFSAGVCAKIVTRLWEQLRIQKGKR